MLTIETTVLKHEREDGVEGSNTIVELRWSTLENVSFYRHTLLHSDLCFLNLARIISDAESMIISFVSKIN